jgi:hypothetical protein
MSTFKPTREETIRECIEYLKGRPGRNAIRSLKALLTLEPEKAPQTKPSKDHPWRQSTDIR